MVEVAVKGGFDTIAGSRHMWWEEHDIYGFPLHDKVLKENRNGRLTVIVNRVRYVLDVEEAVAFANRYGSFEQRFEIRVAYVSRALLRKPEHINHRLL